MSIYLTDDAFSAKAKRFNKMFTSILAVTFYYEPFLFQICLEPVTSTTLIISVRSLIYSFIKTKKFKVVYDISNTVVRFCKITVVRLRMNSGADQPGIAMRFFAQQDSKKNLMH